MIRMWGEGAIAIGVFSIIVALFELKPSVTLGVIAVIAGVMAMIFGTPPQEGEDG